MTPGRWCDLAEHKRGENVIETVQNVPEISKIKPVTEVLQDDCDKSFSVQVRGHEAWLLLLSRSHELISRVDFKSSHSCCA